MADLTPAQTLALAKSMTLSQNSLTDYKLANYGTLSAGDKQKLDDSLMAVSTTAAKLYAETVVLSFADADASIKAVNDSCVQITNSLNTIARVQDAINLISMVAALATSIASSDPAGIITNASSIGTFIAGL